MHRILKLSVTALLAMSLSACIYVGGEFRDSHWESKQRENREMINQLNLDEQRSAVVSRLGTPDFSEAFTIDGDEYRVLYYRTQRRHSDGDTSKDETTPLVFKSERLIGWGQAMLDSLEK